MTVKLEEPPGGVIYNGPATPESGVLNGKALSLPTPPYPRAAHAVKADGTVEVLVTIDVDGTMLSAEAVSGHPLLRTAADRRLQSHLHANPSLRQASEGDRLYHLQFQSLITRIPGLRPVRLDPIPTILGFTVFAATFVASICSPQLLGKATL